MKIAQVQKEVLTCLIKHPRGVVNCGVFGDKVVVSPDGVVGFVFPKDANWLDLSRVEKVCNLKSLGLPLMTQENKLEPTEVLLDRGDALVREYRKQGQQRDRIVYIDEKRVKNFDLPSFYQDANQPRGVIAITEVNPLEGEILVGFVLPVVINKN